MNSVGVTQFPMQITREMAARRVARGIQRVAHDGLRRTRADRWLLRGQRDRPARCSTIPPDRLPSYAEEAQDA